MLSGEKLGSRTILFLGDEAYGLDHAPGRGGSSPAPRNQRGGARQAAAFPGIFRAGERSPAFLGVP